MDTNQSEGKPRPPDYTGLKDGLLKRRFTKEFAQGVVASIIESGECIVELPSTDAEGNPTSLVSNLARLGNAGFRTTILSARVKIVIKEP